MKKFLSIIAMFLMAMALHAQKDVTKFLGIPVDGTKANMIQKLKAKGFLYNNVQDYLTGEFNGMDVHISVVTNNNKVYRIMVVDAVNSNEVGIKIRFNTLCRQFMENKKYTSVRDYRISENEDISYEMSIHNKRYEAAFYQMDIDTTNTAAITEEAIKYITSKYTTEQIEKMSDEEKSSLLQEFAMDYLFDNMTKRSVWFMIDEKYGNYHIVMYYDNEYNMANGEEL